MRYLSKVVAMCLTAALLLSGMPAPSQAAPHYNEHDVYIEKPASEAGNRFYHGAKYEPRVGSYLGMFAQGDPGFNDEMAAPNTGGWFTERVPAVTGKDHAFYLLYIKQSVDPVTRYGPEGSYGGTLKRLGKGYQMGFEPDKGLDQIQDNAYLHNMARSLAAMNMPILFRFASEFNDNANAWHKDGSAKYKEKFRLVARVMHQEAPNVAMVWTPNDWPIGSEDAYYPGDEYVDWVGVSSYPPFLANGAPKQNNTWMDRFRGIYDKYGSRKPIMISEGAAIPNVEYTKTDVSWAAAYELQRFYAGAARRYPNLKGICYWSWNEPWARQIQCGLTTNHTMLNAYKKAIQDPFYLGNFNSSASIYYERLSSAAVGAKTEKLSAYANDIGARIAKVSYYINGTYAGEGAFPDYTANIDFTPYHGQTVEIRADFITDQNSIRVSKKYTATIGGGKAQAGGTSAGTSVPSPAADLRIVVNGKELHSDVPPFIQDGATYLPARALSEALGAKVFWLSDVQTAVIRKDNRELRFKLDDRNFSINGQMYQARVPVRLRNNRTFIPVRAAGEALNVKIDWDGTTRTVTITR